MSATARRPVSWRQGQKVDEGTVLGELAKAPGCLRGDLADACQVHPSTVLYHLDRLQARGLVRRERCGRIVRYYATGRGLCKPGRRVHSVLTPAGRAALRYALEHGVVTQRDVMAGGHSRSAVRHGLHNLEAVGALRRVGWGVYAVRPELASCAEAAVAPRPCRRCLGGTVNGGAPRAGHRPTAGSRP